jgi:hypothetical protein
VAAETPHEPGGPPESPGSAKAGRSARPGRLKRIAGHARAVRENPRALGTILRGALLDIWCARGGGYYGLGYLITFLVLESRMLTREFQAADGVMTFVGGQMLEYLLRISLLSFVNALQAFIWPLLVLGSLGAWWGLVLLAGGYLAFERGLRPGIEKVLPELKRAR